MTDVLIEDRFEDEAAQEVIKEAERYTRDVQPVGALVMQSVELGSRQYDLRRRQTIAIDTGRIAVRRPLLHRYRMGPDYFLG